MKQVAGLGVLLRAVDEIMADGSSEGTRLQRICDLLRREVPRFSWVGFYLAYEETRELLLGPFAGTPTEHTVIPYGRGICGQVADSRQLLIVEDVTAEANYLACSLATKAEIVAPVFFDGQFVGELDIDSHVLGPFESDEATLLEGVAEKTAPLVYAILPRK
jgi:L-methionine (R)-S-oxide reductase